jgi:hypothetical protein
MYICRVITFVCVVYVWVGPSLFVTEYSSSNMFLFMYCVCFMYVSMEIRLPLSTMRKLQEKNNCVVYSGGVALCASCFYLHVGHLW